MRFRTSGFVLFFYCISAVVFMSRETVCALSLADESDYFWISAGSRIREKDGSVTLPLKINYGIFPENKKTFPELEYFRIFYFTEANDASEKTLYYELPAEIKNGDCNIKLRAYQRTRYTVVAEAGCLSNGIKYCYSAKITFILYGNSGMSFDVKNVALPPSHKLDILRQSKFDYWPQTGTPVTFSFSFNNKVLPMKSACIYDENFQSVNIASNADGKYTCIPPDDKKLNSAGETVSKRMLIVLRHRDADTEHVTAFTQILYRSRNGNRNLPAGLMLFGGTAIGMLAVIIYRRRLRRI